MRVDITMKINSDSNLTSFIREYPIWYKNLNRNPNMFNEFVRDMKDKYKLTTSDRINKTFKNQALLQNFGNGSPIILIIL